MSSPLSASVVRRSPRLARWGLIVSVFLAVWSVKLMTIARYGTDLPYWDQWAKEGELFYAPWFDRHEFWKTVFVPHNEHRIAPTLAFNLSLLRLGGDQWDARVQCVASAALHALIAAALAAWALRRLRRPWAIASALVIVLVAAPPIAWENVLGGFQSVFYFVTLFSLLALHLMLGDRPFSWRWLAGLASAGVACVSLGSGMLVAFPIAAVAVLRIVKNQDRRPATVTLLAAVCVGAIGWWLRPQAPWHEVIHAHSLGDSLAYAARCLAWPLYDAPWVAAVFWTPWFLFAVDQVRQPVTDVITSPQREREPLIFAGGLWVLVQAAAVSYSRAGASPLPAPRYGDVFALGLVFSFLALACIVDRIRRAAGPTRPLAIGAGAWLGMVVLAAGFATRSAVAGPLPAKKAAAIAYEQNVQAFVLTDDYAAFAAQEGHLPFPSPEWLAKILRHPTLRRLLPVSVRQPVPLAAAAPNDGHESIDPALPHRRVWTLAATSTWRSKPLPATGGWWKIETKGDIGTPGAALELVAADGRVLAAVRPTKFARDAWRAAYVRAPSEPAMFVARVTALAQSLAFSEPIVMSSLGFWTWRLTEHAGWLAVVAAVGLLLFACLSLRAPSSESHR